jgi:hypothetical protein
MTEEQKSKMAYVDDIRRRCFSDEPPHDEDFGECLKVMSRPAFACYYLLLDTGAEYDWTVYADGEGNISTLREWTGQTKAWIETGLEQLVKMGLITYDAKSGTITVLKMGLIMDDCAEFAPNDDGTVTVVSLADDETDHSEGGEN